MYKFWQDYVKPKHCEKSKLCDKDADNCFVHFKTGIICKYPAEDFETRVDFKRPLPKVKNKKSN